MEERIDLAVRVFEELEKKGVPTEGIFVERRETGSGEVVLIGTVPRWVAVKVRAEDQTGGIGALVDHLTQIVRAGS